MKGTQLTKRTRVVDSEGPLDGRGSWHVRAKPAEQRAIDNTYLRFESHNPAKKLNERSSNRTNLGRLRSQRASSSYSLLIGLGNKGRRPVGCVDELFARIMLLSSKLLVNRPNDIGRFVGLVKSSLEHYKFTSMYLRTGDWSLVIWKFNGHPTTFMVTGMYTGSRPATWEQQSHRCQLKHAMFLNPFL